MDWVYVVLGLLILVLAGDSLVRGAVNLALRLGIPALIVGLTIVAFGTSAPELLVSVKAVLENQPGIALGNVVGSNVANVLMVLGLPALISTIHTSQSDTARSFIMMIGASVLFIALLFAGPLTWWHGLILLAALSAMLLDSYRGAQTHRAGAPDEGDLEGVDPSLPGWQIAIFIVLGLIGLPVGADLLVDGSVEIARDWGVSETVIGLTIVAIGTSLPELAASTMAAIRGQADVAIGNVIGSNMFNLLGIIGVTALVGDLHISDELLRTDVWVMLASSLVLAPFVLFGRDITRTIGVGFLAIYIAYVVSLVA